MAAVAQVGLDSNRFGWDDGSVKGATDLDSPIGVEHLHWLGENIPDKDRRHDA
jgi:hypothetical protein